MKLLKPKECEEFFRVNADKLWRWRCAGMPHLRVGNSFMYPIDEIIAWMRQGSAPSKNVETQGEKSAQGGAQ